MKKLFLFLLTVSAALAQSTGGIGVTPFARGGLGVDASKNVVKWPDWTAGEMLRFGNNALVAQDTVINIVRTWDNRSLGAGSSGHAIDDASVLTRTGGSAYASYGCDVMLNGNANYNHCGGFQDTPTINIGVGNTLTTLFGHTFRATYNSGTVTTTKAFWVQAPSGVSGGVNYAFVNDDGNSASVNAGNQYYSNGARVVIGSTIASSSLNQNFNIEGFSSWSGAEMSQWTNDNTGIDVDVQKSRGTVQNTYTIVQAGDVLGQIRYRGADGAAFQTAVALTASATGTPGAGNVPGEWKVQTANSSGSLVVNVDATSGGTAILGTNTNDLASAGYVGQWLQSIVPDASAVSLTTGTTTNITSISLTAGDWDVTGMIVLKPAGTTTITQIQYGVWTANNALDSVTSANGNTGIWSQASAAPNSDISFQIANYRVSIASTTTIYLNVLPTFGTSTLAAFGRISARRVR